MVKATLRNIIRDTPLLYRIYIKKRLGRDLRLPNQETRLVLEGYPRSGNTFARYHLETAFPELQFSSHVHTLAALKKARLYQTYTIILIRDPREAVASFCCKYNIAQGDREGIEAAIRDYLHFYSYVKSYSADFVIVSFDDLIASPVCFLERIGKVFDRDVKREHLIAMCEEAEAKMLAREPEKEVRGSSLPSTERAVSKQVLYRSLEECSCFTEAVELYRELTI